MSNKDCLHVISFGNRQYFSYSDPICSPVQLTSRSHVVVVCVAP
jgi:hypothetical protein